MYASKFITFRKIEQPYDLKFYNEPIGNLVLMWKYSSPPHCLDSFLIEYSPTGRINDFQLLESSQSVNNFHILKTQAHGWYRISAKNFFGDIGPYSVPLHI